MTPWSTSNAPTAEEEEDDYLTMTFEEPSTNPKHETLTQKKKRQAKEAEERSRTKSKAQIVEEERAKRDAALNQTSMDTNSKGFKMMQKLGYKPGTALGVGRASAVDNSSNDHIKDERLLEPVGVEMKEGRSGIGADSEKKRKFREEVERIQGEEKKRKVDQLDFRERQVKEREEKRKEGQMWGAMKVAERLDEEDEQAQAENDSKSTNRDNKPLHAVNVLWRGLAKQRMINERDKRMRYDLHQSLSRLPTYDDPDEDKDDKIAISRKERLEEVDLELDQDDPELEEFEALSAEERLLKLVEYLRTKWHYCFWCKYRYPDKEMEGCPGITEEDHD